MQSMHNTMGLLFGALLGAALLLSPAHADSVIWAEDFEDEDGNGAFDPMFMHVIGAHPDDPTPSTFNWDFIDLALGGVAFGLEPASDYVTVMLEDGQYVSHASVDVYDSDGSSTILFIGATDTLTFESDQDAWITYEADFSEIGAILAVQIYSWNGEFDDITVTVVPEPASLGLLFCGMTSLLFQNSVARRRRRRSRLTPAV